MLQHNAAQTGRPAHLAHAAVLGMHALCCGAPAAAMLAAALSGMASTQALLPPSFVYFHGLLHRHELWILAVSAALVLAGGWMEHLGRRHRRGFPWLFALSVGCFFVNALIIVAHRALG